MNAESHVALQQAFFSRRQHEGETLQEFSLALLGLMERVKQRVPGHVPNSEALLRDQFVEHVLDNALRRELKQLVRRQPGLTLLEIRAEAICWEREGLPAGVRGRSYSLPSIMGAQYGVRVGSQDVVTPSPVSEIAEIKEILRRQQEQLTQLTQSLAALQSSHPRGQPQFGWECFWLTSCL